MSMTGSGFVSMSEQRRANLILGEWTTERLAAFVLKLDTHPGMRATAQRILRERNEAELATHAGEA